VRQVERWGGSSSRPIWSRASGRRGGGGPLLSRTTGSRGRQARCGRKIGQCSLPGKSRHAAKRPREESRRPRRDAPRTRGRRPVAGGNTTERSSMHQTQPWSSTSRPAEFVRRHGHRQSDGLTVAVAPGGGPLREPQHPDGRDVTAGLRDSPQGRSARASAVSSPRPSDAETTSMSSKPARSGRGQEPLRRRKPGGGRPISGPRLSDHDNRAESSMRSRRPTSWVDSYADTKLGLEEPDPRASRHSLLTSAGAYVGRWDSFRFAPYMAVSRRRRGSTCVVVGRSSRFLLRIHQGSLHGIPDPGGAHSDGPYRLHCGGRSVPFLIARIVS